jgi:pimeloyl-ACP methyl ester carboxylesterase
VNPRPGKRPDWVDGALFPFQSRFVDIDGHVVHYVDEGDGPVLLLLHGNPVWSFVYRDVITRLRDRMRCVALDYPGFGLSSAADGYSFLPGEHAAVVERFIQTLHLSDITLMVNDWGGPIGLSVAGRHPQWFVQPVRQRVRAKGSRPPPAYRGGDGTLPRALPDAGLPPPDKRVSPPDQPRRCLARHCGAGAGGTDPTPGDAAVG